MHTVRTACPADEEEIYRLICSLEESKLPRAPFGEIFRAQVESPAHSFLVCEGASGALSGVLHMQYTEQLHHAARVAVVLELCVDEASRGLGIGSTLFRTACEAAQKAGCAHLELVSNNRRTQAHQFYKKQGMALDHAGFTMQLSQG